MQQQPLSILQLTDLHLMSNLGATLKGIDTAASFKKTLDYALEQHPKTQVVLLTGDLAEEPGINCYQHLADILSEYKVNFCCLPGNHDIFPDMLEVLNQQNFNCDKQLLLDNWQVLMLNSQIPGAAGGNLDVAEIDFLKYSLEQYPNHHTLIAVHHHCIPTHSLWMDTMLIKNSQEFLALLHQYPQIQTVIMGHIHQELDDQIGNLRLLGTPSTCFQFTPLSAAFAINENNPSYRWLQLYPDGSIQSEVTYLP